jgi:hypothetical protein
MAGAAVLMATRRCVDGHFRFSYPPMAREEKPAELRVVDEPTVPQEKVHRLRLQDESPVVRVMPEPVDLRTPIDARLIEPSRNFHDGRTHEPGIEALIEAPAVIESTEEDWGNEPARREPMPWGWFVLVGLILGGAVLWSVLQVKEGTQTVGEVRREAITLLKQDDREEQQATTLLSKIEDVSKRFCEADSIDALTPLIRHPDRVTPLLEKYYADRPVRLGTALSMTELQPLPNLGRGSFWIITLDLDGEEKSLLVEAAEDGSVLVDWESAVVYQPIPWDEYASSRPGGTTYSFRVYLEPDHLFSHEFSDESQWACFRLTAKDSEESLFGYAKRNSPVTAELMELIRQSGGRKVACLLRLGLPKDLRSHRGVVIERIISPRWILVDPSDGEP